MSLFFNPVTVYSGPNGCTELVERLIALDGLDRVLVITRGNGVHLDPSLSSLWRWILGRRSLVIESTVSNPELNDILPIILQTGAFDPQFIVAIGGGSVLDMAKTLSATHRTDIATIADIRQVIHDGACATHDSFLPWIGIPTTSGTGSEMTKWATIWDREKCRKLSLVDDRLYASAALIVPELTRTLPLRLSASTAFDAMTQATEAYWSVRTNPISRVYAIAAIDRICAHLPRIAIDPEDLSARKEISLGSVYAGLAFSNTSTTACHSISYPLTLLHGIDHGIAVAITLGSILWLNVPSLIEPERLFAAYGAESVEEVQGVIQRLFALFDIPMRYRCGWT